MLRSMGSLPTPANHTLLSQLNFDSAEGRSGERQGQFSLKSHPLVTSGWWNQASRICCLNRFEIPIQQVHRGGGFVIQLAHAVVTIQPVTPGETKIRELQRVPSRRT